jgi:hypothetical protein
VLVGCIDVASNVVETPQEVADTIRAALDTVRPIGSTLAPIAAWRRWRRTSPMPNSRRSRQAPNLRKAVQ